MKTKKIIKGSGDEIGQKRQDVTVNPTVAEYTHVTIFGTPVCRGLF